MRSTLAALALAIAVAIGLAVPAATPVRADDTAAAPSGPKVVIVVGATHGATAKYRGYADQAYAEAIRYTSNVHKVYSPNATWTAVRNAAVGASILIYFGHGNGWPSPYTYDPAYKTKDGLGLNATAGAGDGNTKYYGEPSVATLDLAPNAIVLLHHLCYASGNSEPGHAAPSVATARQRVANYGAGFLRTDARAVLADGHRGAVDYLRAIFTTDQSIEQLWRTAPGANGNVSAFASTRTSGMTAFTDPETPTTGFYRSLVGDPKLMTRQITNGFSVPGRAAPEAAGAPLYAAPPGPDTAAVAPVAVLPAAIRLKVLETVSGIGETAVFRVEGLDDPGLAGFTRAADLDPRDSWAPSVVSTSGGGGKTYSAAVKGTHTLSGTFNEGASWTVTIKRGTTTVKTGSGSGSSFSLTWKPAVDGPGDGPYTYVVGAVDGWANGPSAATGSFVIDSTAPTGVIDLDGGATSAVVGVVRVGLTAQDALSAVTKVRLANTPVLGADGLLATGTTMTVTPSVAWTLAVGAGPRTVHAQFQDSAGNWSPVVSDTITVAPPDTSYHALAPVRLLDTRSNVPAGVPTRLTSGRPLRFDVAGRGGVPDDAIAVTGNLTVTGSTTSGYVTLGPIVGPSPATSTINVPKGDTRANGVVVPLDRTGALEAVFVGGTGTTQLVLDVTGYFTAADAATYHAIQPARALDTRAAGGVTAGAPLRNGVPQAVVVAGRTIGGVWIPADAVAVTGNLTVTGQTGRGFLSMTPTPQAAPTTSTLNFPVGDTRANNVTLPVGAAGRVWVVQISTGTSHALLDITGYYTAGAGGARWVPLAPARVLDSRAGAGYGSAFRDDVPGSVTVLARGGIGGDADALTGNLTVVGQTGGGYTSLTPAPDATPATSTLNFPTGEARANGVSSQVDPATGKVSMVYKARAGATTHLLLDVTGYYH